MCMPHMQCMLFQPFTFVSKKSRENPATYTKKQIEQIDVSPPDWSVSTSHIP